jgi:hypothetical protein
MIRLHRHCSVAVTLASLAFGACASSPPPEPETAPTGPSDRVVLVRNLYDWLNANRLEDALTLLDDTVELFDIGGQKHSGKGGARDSFKMMGAAFPGYQRTPTRLIESDIAVISQYTLTGKHTGMTVLEQPPIGNSVGVHGLTIVAFIDDHIGAIKRYQDSLSLVDQLKQGGTATPAPAPGEPLEIALPDTKELMDAQSDKLKAWALGLPAERCEAGLCTAATQHHLMVDGAAGLEARPFRDVLAGLQQSSPELTIDNVWVYPAKGFAVVTCDAHQVKSNPALRLTADRFGVIQLAMVLRFEGDSIAEVWTYLNREPPPAE